jgi:hypothetical protein
MSLADKEDQLDRAAQQLEEEALAGIPYGEFVDGVRSAIEARIDQLVPPIKPEPESTLRMVVREDDERNYEVTSRSETLPLGGTRLRETIREILPKGSLGPTRFYRRIVDRNTDGVATLISLKLHANGGTERPTGVEYGHYSASRGGSGFSYQDGERGVSWPPLSEQTTGGQRRTIVEILRAAGAQPTLGGSATPPVRRA